MTYKSLPVKDKCIAAIIGHQNSASLKTAAIESARGMTNVVIRKGDTLSTDLRDFPNKISRKDVDLTQFNILCL
jgi:hypothetical protein